MDIQTGENERVVVMQSYAAVFMAVDGPIKGVFMSPDQADTLIAALKQASAAARAEALRSASITPEEKREMIDRAMGK